MMKLEQSAASIAEVAVSRDRNVVAAASAATAAGRQL